MIQLAGLDDPGYPGQMGHILSGSLGYPDILKALFESSTIVYVLIYLPLNVPTSNVFAIFER